MCSGRDVRVCAADGLTTDLVRRCDTAPFDDRCVRCPGLSEATCAASRPVCAGMLTGVAGELSLSADASCGRTGCQLVVISGTQLSLTVAEVQLALSVDLARLPSGTTVPLNAQPGGGSAPAVLSLASGNGRCSNDTGTTVRGTPAPQAGALTITYGEGTSIGASIRVELSGHLSCDEGASWSPLTLALDLLVTDAG